MEIIRLTNAWDVYLTVISFHFYSSKYDLFQWMPGELQEKRFQWVVDNARFWDVYCDGRQVGYMAATSHYKGRWVFHFGAIEQIDHKSVIPAAWRLFLQEAEKENVKLVAVYIPDDRADIRRLARIFKFRHFFGNLWASRLKHLKSSRSNKLRLQSPKKTKA